MCPPGIDQDSQKAMIDMVLDAVTLPGSVTTSAEEGILNLLTEAMVSFTQSDGKDENGLQDI